MKNKKGFTLIELLSVIVLIGVVLSLAVLGVSSIRKSILEKQYINIKTEIELAAEKYYNDTEITQMYVQTLLDEGYLKADNESKNIVDPRDKNILNCYIVDIKDENGKLNESDYSKDCNQELNNAYAIKITDEDGNNIDGNKWYASSFIIKAVSNSSEYTWTTEKNPNVIGTGVEYNLENLVTVRGGVVDDLFYVNGVNTDGKVLKSAGQRIKIDTVPPEIDKDDEGKEKINITNENDWAKEKTISVELSDIGSGIASYAFDIVYGCSNSDSWITLDESKNQITVNKVVNEEGIYYFCAKDGAGNTIKTDKIIVKNVDGIPPKCAYDGENTNWTSDDRTISFGCEDNETGCSYIEYGGIKTECNDEKCKSYKFTNSVKTAEIATTIGTFTITDKAGNKTECPVTSGENKKTNLNIYVDKEKPTIELEDVNYKNNSLSVSIKIKDNYSGPDKACIGETNDINLCNNWVNCSSGVCTLNLNTTISDKKYYIIGKDKAGNYTSKDVTIKKISSTNSGTKKNSNSFTENLNINGKILYYSYSAITGSVTCYNTGKCTVTPKTSSYSCTLSENPDTRDPNYSCDKSNHYVDNLGYCRVTNLYPEFNNNTGVCNYTNGNFNGDYGFGIDYGCKGWFDSYYEDVSVFYYCNNCSNNLGNYNNFRDLCVAMSKVSNFGNYTGSKGVTAHKKCEFQKYKATANCGYGEKLKNGTCYSCQKGKLVGYSCEYEGTCYNYEYKYNYTYYVY